MMVLRADRLPAFAFFPSAAFLSSLVVETQYGANAGEKSNATDDTNKMMLTNRI